ncbi:MAG TPA: hypothetical protein VMG09_18625 [Bacteroidota bacterium]|nr:hypothetical protein [Bacteroidota bacterium]
MKPRTMMRGLVVLALVFGFSLSAAAQSRSELINLMEKYIAAVAKHDPSGLRFAKNVKLVENTKVLPIGKGLWETATGGFTNFKIFVADTVTGQVGVIGVIQVNHDSTIISARLKVVDGEITEIDHLVIPRYGGGLNPNMLRVRPGLITPIEPSERVSRNEMLRIANSYYEALVRGNGDLCPFADESQRRENGGVSAGATTPEEAYDDDFSVFRKMKCRDQLNTGVLANISDINRRRFVAVDETMGLVMAYSMFVHTGEPKIMKIKGVPGITERENKYGAFDLPAAHIFKIRNGKVYEIEALGYLAEHGITNGWE